MSEKIIPSYYGGKDNPYEVIKVLRQWKLDENFCLGNVIKYIARAGNKDGNKVIDELRKAATYLDMEIAHIEQQSPQKETGVELLLDTDLLNTFRSLFIEGNHGKSHFSLSDIQVILFDNSKSHTITMFSEIVKLLNHFGIERDKYHTYLLRSNFIPTP